MPSAAAPQGKHPGEIVHEDRIEGRTWKRRADEVPQSIAWVLVDGKWVPVVKIIITGTTERREITKYGPNGEELERTVQGPRPTPPSK